MSQLTDLQQAFQHYLLKPPKQTVPDWVSPGGRAKPEKQLSVYSNGYRARLHEVLMIDFPAVLEAIGEDSFNQLANDYIDAHPSHYYSLREFGRDMSSFLQETAAFRDQPWLSELAIFERSLGQAFDAADAPVYSEQEMAHIPPEKWPATRLVKHPSVQRLDCVWGAPGMWTVLTDENPKEITAAREEPVAWLIWRKNLSTQFRSLGDDEQLALDAVLNGSSIDEVCGELGSLIAEELVPLHFATLLKGWIAQGVISAAE